MPTTLIRELEPIKLPGPVIDSKVRWHHGDRDCQIVVELSLNRVQWFEAEQGGTVPHLHPGDHPPEVYARVTMHWPHDLGRKTYPLPDFHVKIACDSALVSVR